MASCFVLVNSVWLNHAFLFFMTNLCINLPKTRELILNIAHSRWHSIPSWEYCIYVAKQEVKQLSPVTYQSLRAFPFLNMKLAVMTSYTRLKRKTSGRVLCHRLAESPLERVPWGESLLEAGRPILKEMAVLLQAHLPRLLFAERLMCL